MKEPASYSIRVEGMLNAAHSDRLGGLAITHEQTPAGTVTVLTGRLIDQAALLGVLNQLHNMRLPLLSVEYQADQLAGVWSEAPPVKEHREESRK